MSNPFENDAAAYLVLKNDENQHSLWPATNPVPVGWTTVHGEDTRQGCLDYVEAHWTDMRPASLAAAMGDPRP
ncbi:MbtH family protein [Streptomyces syringium]|uniref:MbtH family protein n=1 Tax=Streptomyces syringium TaxID=76729 RepID=UPI0033E91ADE